MRNMTVTPEPSRYSPHPYMLIKWCLVWKVPDCGLIYFIPGWRICYCRSHFSPDHIHFAGHQLSFIDAIVVVDNLSSLETVFVVAENRYFPGSTRQFIKLIAKKPGDYYLNSSATRASLAFYLFISHNSFQTGAKMYISLPDSFRSKMSNGTISAYGLINHLGLITSAPTRCPQGVFSMASQLSARLQRAHYSKVYDHK